MTETALFFQKKEEMDPGYEPPGEKEKSGPFLTAAAGCTGRHRGCIAVSSREIQPFPILSD